jgi:hypothetical protein
MGYNSNAPYVNFAVVMQIFHDFRGHIHRAAQKLLNPFNRVAKRCKSEVSELNSNFSITSVDRDQHVLGFNVSMHDVLLVHVVDGEKKLFYQTCSIRFRKHFVLDDVVEKFTACHQFSDYVEVVIIVKKSDHPDDVRMICL